METSFEIAEADIDAAEDEGLEDQTLADREAEEFAALVADNYLIGQTCKAYYTADLEFEKKTETFKQYLAENRETVLALKSKFPRGFHHTRILIREKMMTWEEFVDDCFGVSRQYIDKLLKQTTAPKRKDPTLGPTANALLQAKIVELETKVEELSEKLKAKASPDQGDMPAAKVEFPSLDTGNGILPDYVEEPTFQDVVHYFKSLDADDQVRQLAVLCEKLDLTMSVD